MFEDSEFEHGLWVCKVPGHENVNVFRGQDSYKSGGGALAAKFDDTNSGDDEDFFNNDEVAGERMVSDDRLKKIFGEG
jgi:hypothetical protein